MAAAITLAELTAFRSAHKGMSGGDVRAKIKTDKAFRDEIERLYVGVYHTSLNTSCSDCWVDAFVLLMRRDLEAMLAQSARQFELKAGALLRDVVHWDKDKNTTHHNLTDDLALYHLATNPDYIGLFAQYPADWREQALAAYNPDGSRNTAGKPVKIAAGASKTPEGESVQSLREKAVERAEKWVRQASGKLAAAKARGDEAAIASATASLARAQANLDAVMKQ